MCDFVLKYAVFDSIWACPLGKKSGTVMLAAVEDPKLTSRFACQDFCKNYNFFEIRQRESKRPDILTGRLDSLTAGCQDA